MSDIKHNIVSILNNSFHWVLGSFVLITLFIIYKREDKRKKFIDMFKSKMFLLSTIISLAFSGYIYSLSDKSEETAKLKKATEQALIAFLISIFAYLDLRVTPFWLVFIISYYLNI